MPEFRVVIDGELHPKHAQAIEHAIQQAVLPHLLAGFDEEGPLEPPPIVLRRHRPIPTREWRGFVAAPLSEHQQRRLSEAEIA